MARRKKLSPKYSKKLFTKTASRTHKKNVDSGSQVVMRGGIRL